MGAMLQDVDECAPSVTNAETSVMAIARPRPTPEPTPEPADESSPEPTAAHRRRIPPRRDLSLRNLSVRDLPFGGLSNRKVAIGAGTVVAGGAIAIAAVVFGHSGEPVAPVDAQPTADQTATMQGSPLPGVVPPPPPDYGQSGELPTESAPTAPSAGPPVDYPSTSDPRLGDQPPAAPAPAYSNAAPPADPGLNDPRYTDQRLGQPAGDPATADQLGQPAPIARSTSGTQRGARPKAPRDSNPLTRSIGSLGAPVEPKNSAPDGTPSNTSRSGSSKHALDGTLAGLGNGLGQ